MMSVSFDFSDIAARLDAITQAAQQGTRPAAQAGAQVIYDEVRARAPVGTKAHSTKGKRKTYQPGNLRKSIYQAFMQKQSGDKSSRYRISWSKKEAFYARFVEFGTSKSAAKPFLRPGYDAARLQALQAVKARMHAEVKRVLG